MKWIWEFECSILSVKKWDRKAGAIENGIGANQILTQSSISSSSRSCSIFWNFYSVKMWIPCPCFASGNPSRKICRARVWDQTGTSATAATTRLRRYWAVTARLEVFATTARAASMTAAFWTTPAAEGGATLSPGMAYQAEAPRVPPSNQPGGRQQPFSPAPEISRPSSTSRG